MSALSIGLVRYAKKNWVEPTMALSIFGRNTIFMEMCVPSANSLSKEDSSRILKTRSQIASRLSENPVISTQAIDRGSKCNNTPKAIRYFWHSCISLLYLVGLGFFLRDQLRILFNSLIHILCIPAGACL